MMVNVAFGLVTLSVVVSDYAPTAAYCAVTNYNHISAYNIDPWGLSYNFVGFHSRVLLLALPANTS
jgi:hypothetical protein